MVVINDTLFTYWWLHTNLLPNLGFKDGYYAFRFSNANITQYHYDKRAHSTKTKLCNNPDKVTVTGNNELLLRLNDTSEEFQDCLKINEDWNKNRSDVVQCRVAKEIDCDSRTRHHKQKDEMCGWQWSQSLDSFKINISDKGRGAFVNISEFVHEESDILGHLRCKLLHDAFFDSYVIEEPFQLRRVATPNPQIEPQIEESQGNAVTVAACLTVLLVLVVSTTVYYSKRKKLSNSNEAALLS